MVRVALCHAVGSQSHSPGLRWAILLDGHTNVPHGGVYTCVTVEGLARLLSRPVARIFRRGVTWMCYLYACMHKYARLGGSGGMLPQGNL